MTWSRIWRGDLKRLSKFERTLENREVWGIGDLKIKVENEEVTGKGDLTIMKRWHEKSTFKLLAFMSKKSWILGGFCCLESNLIRSSDFIHLCMQISFFSNADYHNQSFMTDRYITLTYTFQWVSKHYKYM